MARKLMIIFMLLVMWQLLALYS